MQIPLKLIYLPAHDLRATVDPELIEELADSLRDHGQLQSIGVVPRDFNTTMRTFADMTDLQWSEYIDNGGRFEVVFGARRTRAATVLGWEFIRAEIVGEDTDELALTKKLIENVQRQDLTPMEEAFALIGMIDDDGADIRKLQRQTGKSRDWIKTRLMLINLPEDVQKAVQHGSIGIGVANYLGQIENDEVRRQYVEYAVDSGCTTEQAIIWLQQSQYAEQGLASLELTPEQLERQANMPQPVEQKFPCFCCGQPRPWGRINTLILCQDCQPEIAGSKRPVPQTAHVLPLDKSENGANIPVS